MRFAIKQNTPLTSCVYRMTLQGDTSAITAPGQFVQVQVPGFYLRRPISVCDWDSETLTLVYKVVGNGTDAMCRMIPGTELDLLTGLGNGFDITRCGERPLLIGGGVGLPPMVGLCRCLMQAGKHPTVLAGSIRQTRCSCARMWRSSARRLCWRRWTGQRASRDL